MSTTRSKARRAHQSDTLDYGIRAGFVAYGVVHLVVAFLAIKLALGDKQGSASSTGALQEVAQQPFGEVLLWLIAVGLVLLVLWRVMEAVIGSSDEEGDADVGHRASSAFKAVIYAALAWSSIKVATGSGGGGGSSEKTMTATVMNWPAGQWLVALIGLSVIAYGGFQVYQGWSDKHAEHLEAEGKSGQAGRAYLLLGKIGYTAKGVALFGVGALFVWAGATHKAGKSGGLDQALSTVLGQPFGAVLVGLIGLGLGCYGLFCFARARHLAQ